MKMRFLSLSFLIFSFYLPSNGQVYFGLKDCIATGLENNFSILIARNNETIAKNNFTPGNAGYLPSLDLTGRYGGNLNNTTQNRSDSTRNVSKGVLNTNANASLSLGWTIFDGFSVRTTYQKLNELKQLGILNTQITVENFIADLVSGYYNYILQLQLLNNLKYALTLSKERLRIDQERYLLGSGSKIQVLQSRVYVNTDSSNLSKQFEVVRTTQIRLNELMAVKDLAAEFRSRDTTIDINGQLLYEKLYDEMMAKNTSMAIASKNKVISEKDYRLAVSRSYPYLNFSSGYSYNYNGYSSGPTTNQSTNGMNYGVSFGVNLFDGFNQRRNIRNSSINIENSELRYREIEQGIKADLLTIFNAYKNNLRLTTLEDQNLSTAAENLSIAMERYRLGSLSGIDLREVQKSLLDANERLISVHYQTKLAEISLMLISGNIMEYYQ
jgi:outer membrane protein TolC